ncbi:hypothetical protein L0152_24260 [bacterium]|nr:hypothetical protein [bacterium]
MDEEKPIEEWIKEWFPVEFDHVFISYLPDRDLEGKVIKIADGEKSCWGFRASYSVALLPMLHADPTGDQMAM